MDEAELKLRMKRFNEIEDEIERLRSLAEAQAGNYSDARNGKDNMTKTNTTAVIVGGVIVVAIVSAFSTGLGVVGAILLLALIYVVNSSVTDLKTEATDTLAKIDQLRSEQNKLGL